MDDQGEPVERSEQFIECDTLLLSVGLIPENELSKAAGMSIDPKTGGPFVNDYFETDVEGLFSCGNVLHVNDVVDNVAAEGEIAAQGAYYRIMGKMPSMDSTMWLEGDETIGQIVPQRISGPRDTTLHIRVKKPMNRMILRVGDGFEKKYPYARPSEMTWVKVPKQVFHEAAGPVMVRCEEY